MHAIHGKDEEEGTEMNGQTSHIGDVAIPHKHIIFIPSDLETLEQAQQAAQCFDIDDCLDDGQLGGRRQLLLYRWDQCDVSEYHCRYCSYTTRELGLLEEDCQANEGEQKDRYEDGREGVAWVFVERDDEVAVLEVFHFLLSFLLYAQTGTQR